MAAQGRGVGPGPARLEVEGRAAEFQLQTHIRSPMIPLSSSVPSVPIAEPTLAEPASGLLSSLKLLSACCGARMGSSDGVTE
jgi:hypothetical protein